MNNYKEKTMDNSGQLNETPDNKVVLFTTASHGGAYLFTVIEAATWLSQQTLKNHNTANNATSAELILLPIRLDVFHFIKNLIKKLILYLPESIKKILPERIKTVVAVLPKKQKGSPSLYKSVYSGGKVSFVNNNVNYFISLYRVHLFNRSYLILRSIVIALKLWRQCFTNKKFVPLRFLNLKVSSVSIGDLVASITLRKESRLYGSLQPCRKLFLNLTNAIYLCELSFRLKLDPEAKTYVMVPEDTYLHAVYQRALHKRGVNIITKRSYKAIYQIIPAGEVLRNERIAAPPNDDIIDKNSVSDYMKKRLKNPSESLWYMFRGYNNNLTNDVLNIEDEKLDFANHEMVVVVFLHSFYDAQYAFGLDGFNDIYHWTTTTIDSCLSNKGIAKVLIKLHPNVNSSDFLADKKAIEKLMHTYKDNPRIEFLQKSTSLIALANTIKMFGITHHGSVAEEITFLGQPVIASAYAPWSTSYPFLKTWSTVKEYLQIIESISSENWAPPSKYDMQMLYKYIHEYRMNEVTISEKSSWIKYAKLENGNDVKITAENYIKHNEKMENISHNNPTFLEYMEMINGDDKCGN